MTQDPVASPAANPSPEELCSTDNLKDVCDYVNNRLAFIGLPFPLRILEHPNKEEAAKILNALFALLQQQGKDVEYKEELVERIRRVMYDNEGVNAAMCRMKSRIEQSEREVHELHGKLSQSQKQLEDTHEGFQMTKEELKLVKSNLQHSKTQYMHELRKKDREFMKIQDRMQKLVSDKYHAAKLGVKCANLLPKTKTNVRPEKQEDPMVKIVIDNYEDREKELLAENQKLKKSLYDLHKELKLHIHDYGSDDLDLCKGLVDLDAKDPLESFSNLKSAEVAQFGLPYQYVHQTISEKIKQSLSDLTLEWEKMRVLGSKSIIEDQVRKQKKDIDLLQGQIDEYKKVIQEQQRLLEMSLNNSNMNFAPELAQSAAENFDLGLKQLEGERKSLTEQRQKLEEERRNFTEAAIKLGKERAAIQREKEQIELEKNSAETFKLLESMPSTPAWLKPGFVESTPNKSPSARQPLGQISTPNMAEPSFDSHFGKFSPSQNLEILVESDTLYGTPLNSTKSTPSLKSALKSNSLNNISQQFSGSFLKKEVKISPKLRVKDQDHSFQMDMSMVGMDDLGPVGKPYSPKIERFGIGKRVVGGKENDLSVSMNRMRF